jgi:hypothetical protein
MSDNTTPEPEGAAIPSPAVSLLRPRACQAGGPQGPGTANAGKLLKMAGIACSASARHPRVNRGGKEVHRRRVVTTHRP